MGGPDAFETVIRHRALMLAENPEPLNPVTGALLLLRITGEGDLSGYTSAGRRWSPLYQVSDLVTDGHFCFLFKIFGGIIPNLIARISSAFALFCILIVVTARRFVTGPSVVVIFNSRRPSPNSGGHSSIGRNAPSRPKTSPTLANAIQPALSRPPPPSGLDASSNPLGSAKFRPEWPAFLNFR